VAVSLRPVPCCSWVPDRGPCRPITLAGVTESSEEPQLGVTRRDVLKQVGMGGAALGAGFVGGSLGARPARADEGGYAVFGSEPTGPLAYGGASDPPADLDATALDALTNPPPRTSGPRRYEIDIVARRAAVAASVTVEQWTFNGSAPGPILRATEGEQVSIRVRNLTDHHHNLHLHGRHSPLMDGWEPIPPGGEFTYEVTAGPAGIHPYHCHTAPLAQHVAKGLYGAFIVDPAEPRAGAREAVLLLSGWDTTGAGRNDIYTWNGVAGFFGKYPIKVHVGELVRLYVLNMTEYDPVGSFHLHAETFDVFRTGTGTLPSEHTDTVTLGQGERAILEFRLPELGRYMFHPHQHHMASAGAMGWIAAI